MNHAVVIDASVLVKTVLAEEFSPQAEALVTNCLTANRPILAPSHLPSEVDNAIYQKLRRRNIATDEAEQALGQFLLIPVQLFSSPELHMRAFQFAQAHQLKTVYDSLYVVLAR